VNHQLKLNKTVLLVLQWILKIGHLLVLSGAGDGGVQDVQGVDA
jgi:hypothetical protein